MAATATTPETIPEAAGSETVGKNGGEEQAPSHVRGEQWSGLPLVDPALINVDVPTPNFSLSPNFFLITSSNKDRLLT